MFAETGLLIGFFLPGDTLLALAGALAGPHHTTDVHLPLVPLLIGCPIAAIVGAQVGHLIGVRGGHVLAKPGSAFEHTMRRIEPLLDRFGEGWAVLVCRFIPVLRTFINPAVGILGMPARKFAVWNVVGGAVWTIGILLAGRFVGEKLHIDRYVLAGRRGSGGDFDRLDRVRDAPHQAPGQAGGGAPGLNGRAAFAGASSAGSPICRRS